VFTAASVALIVVSQLLGQPVYDRHLLPVVPFVAAFVITEGGLRRLARHHFAAIAAALLGAFAFLGLVFTASSAVYDSARWHAASELADAGIAPLRIDGGLDWVGFHSRKPMRRHDGRNMQESWWASNYDDFRPCVVILVGGTVPGTTYRQQPFRTWVTKLPFGEQFELRAFERLDCKAAEAVGAS
jgi:hypothetical protein